MMNVTTTTTPVFRVYRRLAALSLHLLILLSPLPSQHTVVTLVSAHGTLVSPAPRQPESLYWYQVGCMIGCVCSGGGKESYPDPASVDCVAPGKPTLTDPDHLSWNTRDASPRGAWNRFMPWRSPGTAVPLDTCGIASGFDPGAKVQYPHDFSSTSTTDNNNNNNNNVAIIAQGSKGSALPRGQITEWVAGGVVEASYYLVVNHGGGYQYRVCLLENMSEENCFVPLAFATDTHLVHREGDPEGENANAEPPIEIPATDVTVGVTPEGAAWRRIPLPACNCDSGSDCSESGRDDFHTSYDTSNGSGSKPYGVCRTGLQFEAPHLTDGTWPEGYGYYVATLYHPDESGKGEGAASSCSNHVTMEQCQADDGASSCRWYPEKAVCYETRASSSKDETDGKYDNNAMSDHCSAHDDESSCVVAKVGDDVCTWFESEYKKACYHKENNEKRRRRRTQKKDSWYITDRLYAPSTPGDYVLQWRWDNEQTPQIWTTCADIVVVAGEKDNENETSSGSGSGSLAPWFGKIAATCFLGVVTVLAVF